jgi:predicted ATP-dependent endonuclease of OLD family
MKIKELWIEDYKLLKDFNIVLDEQLIVMIGQNGSGKSTLLEFTAKIFYDLYEHFVLDEGSRPTHDFKLRFETNYMNSNYEVYITANKKTKEYYEVNIKKDGENSEKYSKVLINKTFNGGYKDILPQNIVMYYSGISDTLEKRFKEFQEKFILKSLDNLTTIEQPFFYFLPENFSTILIGLLSYKYGDIPRILNEQFQIDGFESIEITLQKPFWGNNDLTHYWGAKGDLAVFLKRLNESSNEAIFEEEQIIFKLISQDELESLWSEYGEEKKLFEYLTTLQANGLIKSIEIKVNKNNEVISYSGLSEGEKQLLIILGLKELLSAENSLFLLDEPDTYLHPKWQRDFVQKVLIQEDTMDIKTSFFISSHSANIISGLKKRQLKIINKENNQAVLKLFSFSPYGKPINKLLIDLFKLEGLRFREVDEQIYFLQKFLYSKEYNEEEFDTKLEELGNEIGKDDIAFLDLKLEKIRRDKNAKNQ